MSDVLVIQNSKIEGPGNLGALFESDGFKMDTVYAKKEKIPEKNYSLILILGANESVNDSLSYLNNQQKLIKKYVNDNVPVLGICLGSQLISKTFGGKVFSGPIKEIGFYDDVKIENNSNLFNGIKSPMTVFHWHGETFSLPENSIRIAYSKNFENQAFQYKSAIGIQFHLEVDENIVNLWLNKSKESLKFLPNFNAENILRDIPKKIPLIQSNLEIFYKNFKSLFKL